MLSKEEREHARKVAIEWAAMNKSGDPGDFDDVVAVAELLAEALLDQEDELIMAYNAIFSHVPERMPIHKKIEALIEDYDLMKTVVDGAIAWKKNGQSVLGRLYQDVSNYIMLKGL